MKVFGEHVAAINEDLYVRYVHAFAMDILNKYKSGVELDWRDVELCLYIIHCYGETLTKTTIVFTTENNALTPLGELISETVTSSKYPTHAQTNFTILICVQC